MPTLLLGLWDSFKLVSREEAPLWGRRTCDGVFHCTFQTPKSLSLGMNKQISPTEFSLPAGSQREAAAQPCRFLWTFWSFHHASLFGKCSWKQLPKMLHTSQAGARKAEMQCSLSLKDALWTIPPLQNKLSQNSVRQVINNCASDLEN